MRPIKVPGLLIATAIICILTVGLPAASSAQGPPNGDPSSARGANDPLASDTLSVAAAGNKVSADLNAPAGGAHILVGAGIPKWMQECYWKQLATADFADLLHSFSGVPGDITAQASRPGEHWTILFCPSGPEADLRAGDRWAFPITGIVEAWLATDHPPRRVVDWMIARSYASVELPLQVGTSAPIGDDRAPLITQLPTWLWVDDATWQPISFSPAPLFGITATVTATPRKVTFESADTNGNNHQLVDCGANTGPAYNFSLAEEAQHSDCTLTYHHASSVGSWTLSSTITWNVTYTCTFADGTSCGTGALAPLRVRSTRPVRVAEIEALLVAPGR